MAKKKGKHGSSRQLNAKEIRQVILRLLEAGVRRWDSDVAAYLNFSGTVQLKKELSWTDPHKKVAKILKAYAICSHVFFAAELLLLALKTESKKVRRGIPIQWVTTAHPNKVLGSWAMNGIINFISELILFIDGDRNEQDFMNHAGQILTGLLDWNQAKDRELDHEKLFNQMLNVLLPVMRRCNSEYKLQIATWMMGDLDGANPERVNGPVILKGAGEARERVINALVQILANAKRELKTASKHAPAGQNTGIADLISELNRIDTPLKATKAGFGAPNAFASEDALLGGIQKLVNGVSERITSLTSLKGEHGRSLTALELAKDTLETGVLFIQNFGLGILTMHPRANAKAMQALFQGHGEPLLGFSLPQEEADRIKALREALLRNNSSELTAVPSGVDEDSNAQWLVNTFLAFKKVRDLNGRLPLMLLSETERTSDVLSMILFLRRIGLRDLRVVSLFETPEGLTQAKDIIREILPILNELGENSSKVVPMVGLSDGNRLWGSTASLQISNTIRGVLDVYKANRLNTEFYIGFDQFEPLRGGLIHVGSPQTSTQHLINALGLNRREVSGVYLTTQGDSIFWSMMHESVIPVLLPEAVTRVKMKDPCDLEKYQQILSELMNEANRAFTRFVSNESLSHLLGLSAASWDVRIHLSVRPKARKEGKALTQEISWFSLRAIMLVLVCRSLGTSLHLMGLGKALRNALDKHRESIAYLYQQSIRFRTFIDTVVLLVKQEDPAGFAAMAANAPEAKKLVRAINQNRKALIAVLAEITGEEIEPTPGDATQIRTYLAYRQSVLNQLGQPAGEEDNEVRYWGALVLLILARTSA